MLNNKKKVILFVVEGTTDELALSGAIGKILESEKEKVIFKFLKFDITSNDKINTVNIKKELGNEIKAILKIYSYTPKDLEAIVHILDTDGTYIPEDCIEEGDNEHFLYYPDKIIGNVGRIKKRNNEKSKLMDMLVNTGNLLKTPYYCYYMSSNLEVALFDNYNCTQAEKNYLASKFALKYGDSPEKFIEFLSNIMSDNSLDYKESWEEIRKDSNSLKRNSNLYNYFKGKIEEKKIENE